MPFGVKVGLQLCPSQRVSGWVVIHFLLLSQSVNQQTHIPLRLHVVSAGPWGNSESQRAPYLRGLKVWGENYVGTACQVEGLWNSEQLSSPI